MIWSPPRRDPCAVPGGWCEAAESRFRISSTVSARLSGAAMIPRKMYRSVLAILLACFKLRLQRSRRWMEIVMLPVSQGLPWRGVLALLLALPLASTLSAGAALAQTKITAGMVAHGPAQWPQYIATELGWLKQDNIELDFVTAGVGGPPQPPPVALVILRNVYPPIPPTA